MSYPQDGLSVERKRHASAEAVIPDPPGLSAPRPEDLVVSVMGPCVMTFWNVGAPSPNPRRKVTIW